MTLRELLFYELKFTGQNILRLIKQNCNPNFYRKVNLYNDLIKTDQVVAKEANYNTMKTYLEIYDFLCVKIFNDFEFFLAHEYQESDDLLYHQNYKIIYHNSTLFSHYVSDCLQGLKIDETNYFIYTTCFEVINEFEKLSVFLKNHVS